MTPILSILLIIVMVAVLGVTRRRMFGLVQGGGNPRRSNALMRARVVLQGVALLLIALILLLRHR